MYTVCLEPRHELVQGQSMCYNCYKKNIRQVRNLGKYQLKQRDAPMEIPTCWILILGRDSCGVDKLISYYEIIEDWLMKNPK